MPKQIEIMAFINSPVFTMFFVKLFFNDGELYKHFFLSDNIKKQRIFIKFLFSYYCSYFIDKRKELISTY